MIKIRRSLLMLCSIILCLSLCACHGSKAKKSFEIPDSFDESKNYEITFWAKNDTNKKQVDIYNNAIADFEKFYPNVKVNLRTYTDYNSIYNDIITNIATQTTPNVCITYPDHIATYISGEDVVVPLDDLFRDKNYGLGGSKVKFDSVSYSDIVPEFIKECEIKGTCYAIPYMRSTEACYVNKTYVEKLGYTLPETLTWDFVWEVSEAAMEKDAEGNFKVNGQKVLIPFIYKSTDNMMISMLKQKNYGYSTDRAEIKIFNDDTKGILNTIAAHAKSKAFATFAIVGYPANFLNAGQCIFAIDSTAGSTWMGSDAPLIDISADKLVKFDTEVMMIPQFNVDEPKMISQGPSICVFNKSDSGEVMASWLFAQFLLTNDVQNAYAMTEGYVPVTIKAQQSQAYQEYISRMGEDNETHYNIKIKASKLLMDHTTDTFVTPVFAGSTSLRNAAGQLIETTVKSVRRKEKVDDNYYNKLFSDTSNLYRLDNISVDGTSAKKNLGPLPNEAKILIIALFTVWIMLLAGFIFSKIKRKA